MITLADTLDRIDLVCHIAMKIGLYSKGVFLISALLSAVVAVANTSAGNKLSDVRLEQNVFNPSNGQTVALSYALAKPTQVEIRIFDPDGGLIRTLAEDVDRAAGRARHAWDGRDDSGKIVPDEAYTFVSRPPMVPSMTPRPSPAARWADLTDVSFDASGTVGYKLPVPASTSGTA